MVHKSKQNVLHQYFQYWLLQYALIALVGAIYGIVYSYKTGSEIATYIFIVCLFALLLDAGLITGGYGLKGKKIAKLLVIIASVLLSWFVCRNIASIVSYKISIVFLISTIIINGWSLVLFFKYDRDAITVLTKRDKKVNFYFISQAVLTFASLAILFKYYNNQINSLLLPGFDSRKDGLSASEVIGLVDDKIMKVDLLQTILVLIYSVVFIIPYRKWILKIRGEET